MVLRATAFAALWWALNRGDLSSFVLGLPVVLLCAWLTSRLSVPPDERIDLVGLLRFLIYFLGQSVKSSLDVSYRVLHPALLLRPGFIRYRLRLEPIGARVLVANATSLMPGTLSVDLEGDELLVHVLDVGAPTDLPRLEELVARVYAIGLEAE